MRSRRSVLVAVLLLPLAPPSLGGQALTPAGSGDTLTLPAVARAALAADPFLRARSAGERAAEASGEVARAARLPELSVAASMARFGEPMVVAPLHSLDPGSPPDFDRTLAQARLVLGWTVYDGGAREARLDLARALTGAASAGVEEARAQVLEGVAEAFLAVLTAEDIVVAELERVRALEAEQGRAARLLAEGAAPRLDLLRAEAETGAALAALAGAESRLALARSRLALLTGIHEDRVRAATLADLGSLPPPDTAGAGGRPPAVDAALDRVDAAEAALREARAAFLPRIAALGQLQQLGGAETSFTTEWQGGFQVEYPLFTGGRRDHALQRTRAELDRALAEAELATRQVAEAALASLTAYEEARARMLALAPTVSSFEELVRVEGLALAEGAGVQSDFLRAQAGLLAARSDFAIARRAALLASVRRARALGSLTLAWLETFAQEAR